MIFMVIYLFAVLAALGLGLLAAWTDYKGMVIPNYIVVFITVAFGLGYGAAHFAGVDVFASLRSHLMAGFILLVVTFVMFSLKMVGGGDSKLVTAFAFWSGIAGLPVFLFYTMTAGALFGVAAIILKRKKPLQSPVEGSWVARVQAGESVVPYGIPIAIGAFAAFFDLGFLNPEILKLFLVSN